MQNILGFLDHLFRPRNLTDVEAGMKYGVQLQAIESETIRKNWLRQIDRALSERDWKRIETLRKTMSDFRF